MRQILKDRRVWLLVVVMAAAPTVLVCLRYFEYPNPDSRIEKIDDTPLVTQAVCLKLRLGMTEPQIAAIIGAQAGKYVSGSWGISGGGVPEKRDGRAVKRNAVWLTPT